jgi:hypothetical protein
VSVRCNSQVFEILKHGADHAFLESARHSLNCWQSQTFFHLQTKRPRKYL